jgi:hypothetical protein
VWLSPTGDPSTSSVAAGVERLSGASVRRQLAVYEVRVR